MPGLRIEIGVAAAGIDGAVPDADIRETGGVSPTGMSPVMYVIQL